MAKLLYRYLLYFGVFIVIVQMLEYSGTQELFAKYCFKFNSEALGTYAPLFLSVLLIDVTYRIGKRQNEIAKQQVSIQQQQYLLEKFNNYKDLHRNIYHLEQVSQIIYMHIYSYHTSTFGAFDKNQIDNLIKELDVIERNIDNDQADYLLRYGENAVMLDTAEYIAHIQVLLANTLSQPLPPSANENRYYIKRQVEMGRKRSDEEWIAMIINAMVNKDSFYEGNLRYFSKRKNELFGENNITKMIRDKYNK